MWECSSLPPGGSCFPSQSFLKSMSSTTCPFWAAPPAHFLSHFIRSFLLSELLRIAKNSQGWSRIKNITTWNMGHGYVSPLGQKQNWSVKEVDVKWAHGTRTCIKRKKIDYGKFFLFLCRKMCLQLDSKRSKSAHERVLRKCVFFVFTL